MGSSFVQVKLDEQAFADLNKKLAGLANELPAKVFINASRKALKPTLDIARAGAPVRTGSLRKSLWIRIKKYPSTKSIYAAIGARVNFKGKDDKGSVIKPFKYIHLVEFGHRGRKKISEGQISQLYDRYEQSKSNRAFRNLKSDIRDYRKQGQWYLTGKQKIVASRKAESALRRRYRTKIDTKSRGSFRGYGFMRKAFNTTKGSALNIFVTECQKGVQQVLDNKPIAPAQAA